MVLDQSSLAPQRASPLLQLNHVSAGYGRSHVLHEISLQIGPGETLLVVGRNGVGKTTLVETIIGLTDHHDGQITWRGQSIEGLPPHARNRAGIAWVPQSREIFPSLTVQEHLHVVQRPGAWTVDSVYNLFPRLLERRFHHGDKLSGGEQQMLALGRALVTNPKLLLLDEPVEGLAPVIVDEMMTAIDQMRANGAMSILLVEQKYELALKHSERCVVIDHGDVVYEARSADLVSSPEIIEQYLSPTK